MKRLSVLSMVAFATFLTTGNTAAGGPPRRPPVGRAAASPQAVKEWLLFSFDTGPDGGFPNNTLMADDRGVLYGTTPYGGTGSCTGVYPGCGTVFTMTPALRGYTEDTIYSFPDAGVGSYPNDGLVMDKAGALYGTTHTYSNAIQPIMFKLSPTPIGYVETTLYRFGTHYHRIAGLWGPLTAGPDGAFFGIDTIAEYGWGAVYKMTSSASGSYTESFLYNFQGPPGDGADPVAPLLTDRAGALYGTTTYGGSNGCAPYPGCGTFYKLTPTPSGYQETILYRFQGGADGEFPDKLVGDPTGTVYGATGAGGGGVCAGSGCGTVFKLTRTRSGYVKTILYRFVDGDLSSPHTPVVIPRTGALFGTAQLGVYAQTAAIYKLTPTKSGYVESDVYAFSGPPPNDGQLGGYVLADKRSLFLTTFWGGAYGNGAVFRVRP
jgi:uncharacterized protein YceK